MDHMVILINLVPASDLVPALDLVLIIITWITDLDTIIIIMADLVVDIISEVVIMDIGKSLISSK
jgi:hypothetical protein